MKMLNWQAKLFIKDKKDRQKIFIYSEEWNKRLAKLCTFLKNDQNGTYGDVGKQVFECCMGTQGSDVLDKLSDANAKPTKSSKEKTIAKHDISSEFKKTYGVLPELVLARNGILPQMWYQLRNNACSIIKSNNALQKNWHKEYKQALKNLEEFKSNNPDFVKILPIIENFEETYGNIARSNRWIKFADFCLNELVNWRNDNSVANKLTQEEIVDTKKSRRHKSSRYVKLVYDKNPSLKDLDDKIRQHRKLVRQIHCNPSFTLPSPTHPHWPTFQKECGNSGNNGYKKLNTRSRTIEFAIEKIEKNINWIKAEFVPDHRISDMRKLPQSFKIGKNSYEYEIISSGERFFVQPQRITIETKNNELIMHLSVAIENQSESQRFAASLQEKLDKASSGNKSFAYRKKIIDNTLIGKIRTMAVDISMRHAGALTIANENGIIEDRFMLPNKSILKDGSVISIPSHNEIAQAYRQLGSAQRRTGSTPCGETANKMLQNRYNNLRKQKVIKTAVAYVRYARYHKCQVIIIENLKNLVPHAAGHRSINNRINQWCRGQLAKWIKHIAPLYGIVVIEVPAVYTSQICPTCNNIGTRFQFKKDWKTGIKSWRNKKTGNQFVCSHCGTIKHADIIASENLQRVFRETFPWAEKLTDKEYELLVSKCKTIIETKNKVKKECFLAAVNDEQTACC